MRAAGLDPLAGEFAPRSFRSLVGLIRQTRGAWISSPLTLPLTGRGATTPGDSGREGPSTPLPPWGRGSAPP
jgi:hypothetical protein